MCSPPSLQEMSKPIAEMQESTAIHGHQQCGGHHSNIFCSVQKIANYNLLYFKLSSLPRVRGSVEDSDSYVLGEMIGFHQRK